MIEISIQDNASPRLRALLNSLSGAQTESLHRVMAFGVERLVRRHIRERYATRGNALGAPSTGFWSRVIDSTTVQADTAAGTVSISERGAALRYYGGTVRPKNKQWLTIPAAREAHGKRAAEVSGGYSKQQWLFGRRGPYAIAEKVAVNRSGRQTAGRVLFWLVKAATHSPDPGVLPSLADMAAAAVEAATDHIKRSGQ